MLQVPGSSVPAEQVQRISRTVPVATDSYPNDPIAKARTRTRPMLAAMPQRRANLSLAPALVSNPPSKALDPLGRPRLQRLIDRECNPSTYYLALQASSRSFPTTIPSRSTFLSHLSFLHLAKGRYESLLPSLALPTSLPNTPICSL